MQNLYAFATYPTEYTNPFILKWEDITQYPGNIDADPVSYNGAYFVNFNNYVINNVRLRVWGKKSDIYPNGKP